MKKLLSILLATILLLSVVTLTGCSKKDGGEKVGDDPGVTVEEAAVELPEGYFAVEVPLAANGATLTGGFPELGGVNERDSSDETRGAKAYTITTTLGEKCYINYDVYTAYERSVTSQLESASVTVLTLEGDLQGCKEVEETDDGQRATYRIYKAGLLDGLYVEARISVSYPHDGDMDPAEFDTMCSAVEQYTRIHIDAAAQEPARNADGLREANICDKTVYVYIDDSKYDYDINTDKVTSKDGTIIIRCDRLTESSVDEKREQIATYGDNGVLTEVERSEVQLGKYTATKVTYKSSYSGEYCADYLIALDEPVEYIAGVYISTAFGTTLDNVNEAETILNTIEFRY